jgi:hypothetical protein
MLSHMLQRFSEVTQPVRNTLEVGIHDRLAPHGIRTFKLSNDPEFVNRLANLTPDRRPILTPVGRSLATRKKQHYPPTWSLPPFVGL